MKLDLDGHFYVRVTKRYFNIGFRPGRTSSPFSSQSYKLAVARFPGSSMTKGKKNRITFVAKTPDKFWFKGIDY